jgi:polysaccharide biosynthesis protein PslH
MTSLPKILFITQAFPYPPDKDGLRRIICNLIKYLHGDFDVTLLSYIEPEEKKYILHMDPYCSDIKTVNAPKRTTLRDIFSSLSTKPSTVSRFWSGKMHAATSELCKTRHFDLIIPTGLCMGQFALDFNEPKIIAPIDIASLLYKKRSVLTKNIFTKLLCYWEFWRLKRYESVILPKFDKCYLVSGAEKVYIEDLHGLKNIFVAENGIDTKLFKPRENFATENALLFTGVMNYGPNVDAAIYLCEQIMPLLWEKYNDLKVYIAGRDPTDVVKCLANDRIIVTGFVADLGEYYAKSRIFISPLRYGGAGVKCKVLEALAMGKPVIASSLTLEGQPILSNVAITANSAGEIVEEIDILLQNRELEKALGMKGREIIEKNYSWERTFQIVRSEIKNLILK